MATSSLLERPSVVAAVDLGSNSFHMVVARVVQGQVHVLDRLNERVALAAGLDERKRLTASAQRRALECLARFGQRLKAMPRGSVRAVGTNTLRQARNASQFLARARAALGHPIEVVSGREEARLIYAGVAHAQPEQRGRRLVVDVGGGSTEAILGEGYAPLLADSLYMGCVEYSARFFPKGRLTARGFEKGVIAARLELETIERRYRAVGWDECIGSSGTILAIDGILRAMTGREEGITPRGLGRLVKAVLTAGDVRALSLPGLTPERAPVLGGGLCIVQAVFEAFDLERMRASHAALREGLLQDLLGRIRHDDVRDRTIRRMSERHHADAEQAARVERTALAFLEQVAPAWGLEGEADRQVLGWAARLHEIGLSVAHSGHHRHGAYLLANSDMPGFSRVDQATVAALVRWHRRKVDLVEMRASSPEGSLERILRLVVLLRLSVLLHRARDPGPLPRVRLEPRGGGLAVRFPRGWLRRNPLTAAELEEERSQLAGARFKLSVA